MPLKRSHVPCLWPSPWPGALKLCAYWESRPEKNFTYLGRSSKYQDPINLYEEFITKELDKRMKQWRVPKPVLTNLNIHGLTNINPNTILSLTWQSLINIYHYVTNWAFANFSHETSIDAEYCLNLSQTWNCWPLIIHRQLQIGNQTLAHWSSFQCFQPCSHVIELFK